MYVLISSYFSNPLWIIGKLLLQTVFRSLANMLVNKVYVMRLHYRVLSKLFCILYMVAKILACEWPFFKSILQHVLKTTLLKYFIKIFS